jgi:transcription initiation factor TFIIB
VLGVPGSIEEEAALIYARGLKRSLTGGRPSTWIVVASLYAACRETKVAVTLDDLSAASGIDRKEIATCYRVLVSALNMDVPVVDPAEYVGMVASRARASQAVQVEALEILSKGAKAGVVDGRNPIGLAASALYIASMLEGEGMTQKRAAEAAGVREATLRSEYQHLKKAL